MLADSQSLCAVRYIPHCNFARVTVGRKKLTVTTKSDTGGISADGQLIFQSLSFNFHSITNPPHDTVARILPSGLNVA